MYNNLGLNMFTSIKYLVASIKIIYIFSIDIMQLKNTNNVPISPVQAKGINS